MSLSRSAIQGRLRGCHAPRIAVRTTPARRLHTPPPGSARAPISKLNLSGVLGALGAAALVTAYAAAQSPLALESSAPKGDVDQTIDIKELAKHNTRASCWVSIEGTVWDVTEFLAQHPGGAEAVIAQAGKDATAIFKQLHPAGTLDKVKSHITKVGVLSPLSLANATDAPQNEDTVEKRRAALLPTNYVINISEFEELAGKVLGKESTAWSYFFSWADDGVSFKEARSAWSLVRFLPRINIPVGDINSETTYLSNGKPVPFPLIMCPTGGSGLAHPDGEFNLTRAAAKTGVPQIVSNAGSKTLSQCLDERDEIVRQGGPKAPVWMQIYIKSKREDTEQAVIEAGKKGVEAFVITVDVPVLGNRESHDQEARRNAIRDGKPLGAPTVFSGAGNSLAGHTLFDRNMTWDDIAWVRKLAPGVPVLIKGINTVDDVLLAKKYGADGVFISNHGARQLDCVAPPLATLVRLRDQAPHLLKDPRFDVFLDGGVTRGTDILKALCLGAKGVGVGRTMLYAQATHGEAGVLRATEILLTEFHRGMRLLGARSIAELKPEMVEVMDGLVGRQMKS